jgi:hypothetical protein
VLLGSAETRVLSAETQARPVCLAFLVYLVCLVCLVKFVQRTKQTKETKRTRQTRRSVWHEKSVKQVGSKSR